MKWKTVKRVVNSLLPFDKNPRKISSEKMEKLKESIKKFDLSELPLINEDNTIISGHQRIKALQLIGKGEEEIDVRVPNKKLNSTELKEISLLSNSHFGEWDFEKLQIDFEEFNFEDFGIDFKIDKINEKLPDFSEKIKSRYVIEIECKDESEQEAVFEKLKPMYQCRLLTL